MKLLLSMKLAYYRKLNKESFSVLVRILVDILFRILATSFLTVNYCWLLNEHVLQVSNF